MSLVKWQWNFSSSPWSAVQARTSEFVSPLVPSPKRPFLGSLATTSAVVTSSGAGGTKCNPPAGLLATSPKSQSTGESGCGHEIPVLPGWKVLGRKPYPPADIAQERFNLGMWCSHKQEKQIVLKFMAFWQFELASLSQVATSLKVNIRIRLNACPRQKPPLSGLPGDLFNG